MLPKIIPVIHYADDEQVIRNADLSFAAGCPGVMLIHMEGRNELLPSVATLLKGKWPDRMVGLNFLGMDPEHAVADNIANGFDMTWTDAQPTHSAGAPWRSAARIRDAAAIDPDHLVFVGVAFKHQAHEPHPVGAALRAWECGFIPTTSGPATGVAAEASKISDLRRGVGGDCPLAIASGITPENARDFAPHLSHILVATGISSSFHEIDPERLARLVAVCA